MTDSTEQEISEQRNAPKETEKGVEQEIQTLKEENTKLSEEKLRLLADFDNYKKRSARERQKNVELAKASLLEEMISVLDDIERAVEKSEEPTDFIVFLDGIKLVHAKFLATLEKFGITVIDSGEGVRFDPNYHEAVFKEYSETHGSGTIISEVQRGYLLNGHLLRPSRVSISEGIDPQGGFKAQVSEDVTQEYEEDTEDN